MRWPLVTVKRLEREVAEAKRLTRRSLVDHLRHNRRGFVVLDNVTVEHSELRAPLHVLGDHVIVANNLFTAERHLEAL